MIAIIEKFIPTRSKKDDSGLNLGQLLQDRLLGTFKNQIPILKIMKIEHGHQTGDVVWPKASAAEGQEAGGRSGPNLPPEDECNAERTDADGPGPGLGPARPGPAQ